MHVVCVKCLLKLNVVDPVLYGDPCSILAVPARLPRPGALIPARDGEHDEEQCTFNTFKVFKVSSPPIESH